MRGLTMTQVSERFQPHRMAHAGAHRESYGSLTNRTPASNDDLEGISWDKIVWISTETKKPTMHHKLSCSSTCGL